MARLPTTTDVFNAVGEPHRREILELLAQRERSVTELVELLGIRQPQVSKHLHVLKAVGLVSVRVSGKQRLYSLNGDCLKPIHDWVKTFERFWVESLDRLADYVVEVQAQEASKSRPPD